MIISSTPEWKAVQEYADGAKLDLRTLLTHASDDRLNSMFISFKGINLDFSRQRLDQHAMNLLDSLAQRAGLQGKIQAMFRGDKINQTEGRSVLHVALRNDSRPEVAEVLGRIRTFAEAVRSGQIVGATGKKFTNFLCIGIGGSYLGPEFVFEALKSAHRQGDTQLRFLANVDPVDIERSIYGLDLEATLVIVISKTFTTAETMLNAVTVKKLFVSALGSEEAASQNFCAISTALDKTKAFGIPEDRVFGFWDWVGGRFSVTSAVGVLPLSLYFGWEVVQDFLAGARAMDEHFLTETKLWKNIPIVLGLCAVWNSAFLNLSATAVLPYAQSLVRFVAHVQQLDMESIGKSVTLDGDRVDFQTGPAIFGEPGTNGQHSFYQLLHQGTRVIPAEFIGFAKSQVSDITSHAHSVDVSASHDELMSNFFAQPDALALGRDNQQHPEKNFPGNRPSLSILMPQCDAWHVGALLALYEHRTAVQAFIYGINAFDQFGVELGKVLAKEVRAVIDGTKPDNALVRGTRKLIEQYKKMKQSN